MCIKIEEKYVVEIIEIIQCKSEMYVKIWNLISIQFSCKQKSMCDMFVKSWRNSKQEVPRDGQDAAKFWQNAIILSEHCQKFIQQLSKWWRKECQALQFFSDAILRKSCKSQKMLQM